MRLEMEFCAKNQEDPKDRGKGKISCDFIMAKFVLLDDATIFFDARRDGEWSEELTFCDLDYADLKAIKAFAEAAMAKYEFDRRTEFDSTS